MNSAWLGSRVLGSAFISSVGRILSTSLVSSAVDATPITPIENMSPRWYSSLAPPPTM
jgi:hypothetical protein